MIILRNMMSRVNSITLAVTVSFPDGKVRATIPEHITPTHTCLWYGGEVWWCGIWGGVDRWCYLGLECV